MIEFQFSIERFRPMPLYCSKCNLRFTPSHKVYCYDEKTGWQRWESVIICQECLGALGIPKHAFENFGIWYDYFECEICGKEIKPGQLAFKESWEDTPNLCSAKCCQAHVMRELRAFSQGFNDYTKKKTEPQPFDPYEAAKVLGWSVPGRRSGL